MKPALPSELITRALPKAFRYDINALRALAVLAVIAYHYGLPHISGGFAGVDVFYVISGFLITCQIKAGLKAGTFSFQSFYLARLRRIAPALIVVCSASLAWGWFYVLPFDYRTFSRDALTSILFVSNIAFSGQHGYFELAAHSKPLLHTWSLSVEWQYYALLSIYLWTIWQVRNNRLASSLVAASIASMLWCLLGHDHVKGFYLLPGRAWEFTLGGLVSYIPSFKWTRFKANLLGLVGLSVLLGSFIFLNPAQVWPSIWTLVPVSAVLALLMTPDTALLDGLWGFWPIQRLGDLSYSLYLWHWPVLVYAQQYLASPSRLSPLWTVCLLVLTLFLSVLSWKFVEQPIRERRSWWTGRRLTYGSCGVALAFFAFTAFVVAEKGLPERFPAYVQRAFSAVAIDTPRPECFRDINSKKNAKEEFCSFGRSPVLSAPTMLLWGDSHANQYLEALTTAVQSTGIVGAVATQSECGPSRIDSPAELSAEMNSGCEHFNAEVRNFIRQTPQIKTVVLGRLWRGPVSVTNTVALTKELVASGKSVILVGPLPAGGVNVPEYWSQLQIHAGHAIDDVTVKLDSQSNTRHLWELAKMQLASDVKKWHVVLIDPFESLCEGNQCYLVRDGVPNIRDYTHLSEAGALKFVPIFAGAITHSQLASADSALGR